MEDPQVIVGQAYQCRWMTKVPTKRIPMAQACAEMAKYWRCTPEDARESLLKHGYASSPSRDWRVVGRGFDEGERW
jgi:hypothetical protein